MSTSSSEDKGNADQTSRDKLPKKFTWREMSALNKPENAHVAYKGKVRDLPSPSPTLSLIFFIVLRFMMLVVLYHLILEASIRL